LPRFFAGTKTGHDPAPAETTYPVTAGVTSAAGVQRTTMPVEPNLEVTDVGAFGSENVAASVLVPIQFKRQ